jgi:hypothetical protein
LRLPFTNITFNQRFRLPWGQSENIWSGGVLAAPILLGGLIALRTVLIVKESALSEVL